MKEREERGGGVGLGGRVAVCLVFVGTKAKENKWNNKRYRGIRRGFGELEVTKRILIFLFLLLLLLLPPSPPHLSYFISTFSFLKWTKNVIKLGESRLYELFGPWSGLAPYFGNIWSNWRLNVFCIFFYLFFEQIQWKPVKSENWLVRLVEPTNQSAARPVTTVIRKHLKMTRSVKDILRRSQYF